MEAKNHLSSLLLQIGGKLYYADNNFASYELQFVNGSNVDLVGYSEPLKELLVRFSNGKKYIYKDVLTREIFDGLTSECASIGSYLNRKVKGYFRYEYVEWGIHEASLTDVCKVYRTLQYNLDFLIGCHATDAGKKVEALIGAEAFEALFWEAEYTEIPENCQRIK